MAKQTVKGASKLELNKFSLCYAGQALGSVKESNKFALRGGKKGK